MKYFNSNIYSITLPDVAFDNDILYFLIYLIIGIILLAAPLSQIMDTEADYQLRQVNRPENSIDLTYIILNLPRNPVFFYDKTDPSGVKIQSLFAPTGYDSTVHNGIRGYTGVTSRTLNANNELLVEAFPLGIFSFERAGGVILSNVSAIRKELIPSRPGSSVNITRLCVLENR